MTKPTIFTEEDRDNINGWTNIRWRCRSCNHIINLPQQQNFNYCMHCGAKVIKKIGGKVMV